MKVQGAKRTDNITIRGKSEHLIFAEGVKVLFGNLLDGELYLCRFKTKSNGVLRTPLIALIALIVLMTLMTLN